MIEIGALWRAVANHLKEDEMGNDDATERRKGKSKLVYDKATRTIVKADLDAYFIRATPDGWTAIKRLDGYNLVRDRDGISIVAWADPLAWITQIQRCEEDEPWSPQQILAMQTERPILAVNRMPGFRDAIDLDRNPYSVITVAGEGACSGSLTVATDDLLEQRNAAWEYIRYLEAIVAKMPPVEVPFICGGHYDPADSERLGYHLIWWPDELKVPFFDGEKGSRTLHVNCPTSGMPTYYDIGHDERKPITQADLDNMVNGIQALSLKYEAARDALIGESVLLTEMAQRNGEIVLLRQALAAKDARIAELKSVLACTPVAFDDPNGNPAPEPGFLRAIRVGNKQTVGMVTGRGDMPMASDD